MNTMNINPHIKPVHKCKSCKDMGWIIDITSDLRVCNDCTLNPKSILNKPKPTVQTTPDALEVQTVTEEKKVEENNKEKKYPEEDEPSLKKFTINEVEKQINDIDNYPTIKPRRGRPPKIKI